MHRASGKTNRMDVWRAAKLLVDQHGTDAPIKVARRADEMLARGDAEGQAVWKRILRVVEELTRREPNCDERVN